MDTGGIIEATINNSLLGENRYDRTQWIDAVCKMCLYTPNLKAVKKRIGNAVQLSIRGHHYYAGDPESLACFVELFAAMVRSVPAIRNDIKNGSWGFLSKFVKLVPKAVRNPSYKPYLRKLRHARSSLSERQSFDRILVLVRSWAASYGGEFATVYRDLASSRASFPDDNKEPTEPQPQPPKSAKCANVPVLNRVADVCVAVSSELAAGAVDDDSALAPALWSSLVGLRTRLDNSGGDTSSIAISRKELVDALRLVRRAAPHVGTTIDEKSDTESDAECESDDPPSTSQSAAPSTVDMDLLFSTPPTCET